MAQRGRPPKIAPQDQVARAMGLFWSRGYLDTRIEDLVGEAGANRFSLYARHGGKQGLYLKALELYREEVMAQFLEPLAGEHASLAEIHRFFAQFLAALDDPGSRLGCLICAAAVEAAPLERAIADRVAGYVAELDELFRTILERARARGEITDDAEPAMLADHLVGAVVGLMTLARSPMSRALVKNYVRGVLRLIESLARTPYPHNHPSATQEHLMAAEYRMTLAPQTLENAAPDARTVLKKAKAQVGFVPNMYASMVNSPGVLETYLNGYKAFREASGFTPAEQETVLLTISRVNGCAYCMAAHSMLAEKKSGLADAVTAALRDDRPIPDPKLAALSTFTRQMVEKRGLISKADGEAFLGAGYTERHMLEIVLAIAVKTLSNYSNHLFHTKLDEMFAGHAWNSPKKQAA